MSGSNLLVGLQPIRWLAMRSRALVAAARCAGRVLAWLSAAGAGNYFNRLENGVIWPLVIYAKAMRGNIPAHLLKAIKEELDHD